MSIRIQALTDYSDHYIFDILATWDNDPEIKSLITPGMNEGDKGTITGDELMYFARENKSKHMYLTYDDDRLIGAYTIDTAFEHCLVKEPGTAWIGIVIGDKSYWGHGIGRMMMIHLEDECKKLECTQIELGVFEYNERARALYLSLGYEVIDTIDNFVFYNGEWHKDIRMLKVLEEH